MEIISTTLVLFATLLVSLLTFLKWNYKYWERKNIPFDESVIPFGSYAPHHKESFGTKSRKQYETAKAAGFKEYGVFLFWSPVYFPIDPQIIKNILSVDFHSFVDRGVLCNKKVDPLSANLFSVRGQEWKNLRIKLTPTFTSVKIKMMIPNFIDCANQLKKAMDYLVSLDEPVDFRELLGKFTTDVIGSCAFGIDCNSFENPNSEFIKHCKTFFRETTYERMKGFFAMCYPNFVNRIGIALTNKDVTKFFLRIVKETVEFREKNKVVRNDFMQLLLNLKNDPNNQLTLEEITAQAFIFFLAGYETSSSAMSFCLFELSQNVEIQEKVREEINMVLEKHDGKVTYEAIMDMKYLNQVVDETLRKFPPFPILFRQSVVDYKLQGSDHFLEKGTTVFISVVGLHYDSEYFSEPEKFDPDRFSEENKSKINAYTYLPFGEGPRNCIGLRFGLMQVKVGLICLLQNFKFTLNEKTRIPLEMDPTNFVLLPIGGIWLNSTRV